MIGRTFAGVDQPDCAAIQINDLHYTCTVYRVVHRVGNIDFGTSLRARCFLKQPHNQVVEFFDLEIATADITDADSIDCAKIIAVGTTFVVVYVTNDGADSRSLNMSTLDMSTYSSSPAWDDQGAISTHDSALFDLVNVQTDAFGLEFSATEYIVVHRTDTDHFDVRRHDGFSWIDTVYITDYTTPSAIADRVLGAYCFEGLLEPYVLVTYQTAKAGETQPGEIRTARFTSTNGVNTHDTATFPHWAASFSGDGNMHCSVVSHIRRSSQRVVVAAEILSDDDAIADPEITYKRQVIYVEVNTTNLTNATREHGCTNVHLMSRLFVVPSQSDIGSPSLRVRCVLGFRSMQEDGAVVTREDGTTFTIGGPWIQTYAYVADLARDIWTTADELTARPFIVSQLNRTIVDSRASGYVGYPPGPTIAVFPSGSATRIDCRRTNHPCHLALPPDFGPDVKSWTVALGGFARNISTGVTASATQLSGSNPVKLEPTDAMIMNWELHYEEPWVVWRDGRDQPTENFAQEYALAPLSPQQVGPLLLLGGGTPSVYDGAQMHELGFPWYPEIINAADADQPLSTLDPGTYYYSAVYEWPDKFGVLHRSTFAVPARVDITDVQRSTTLAIRCVNVSLKDNEGYYPDAAEIRIVVYRTAVDQQVLYRLYCLDQSFDSTWALANTPRNDPLALDVSIEDFLPDATLTGVGDPLPWQPLVVGDQILDPGPVPGACAIAVWQERVWLASLEDPDVIYYSLVLQRGLAPEFNDANTYRRDNLGPVVAMVAMDTQLIILTKDRIYSLLGLPNDDLGRDNNLELRILASGIGCINPRSVVHTTDQGIFFQSRKGYYQLDRGGNLNYIGADVEDYIRDAGSILSAVSLEDRHQVRLVCNAETTLDEDSNPVITPVVLVYDTLFKWWGRALPPELGSVERGHEAIDGAVWRIHPGEISHVVLQQEGVLVERASDDTPFGDRPSSSNVGIPADIQTSWINTAGVAGLQRIWEIMLTLTRPTASQITCTVEYSLGGTGVVDYTQTVVFASGTDTPLRIRPSVQKCAAFRLRIRETGTVPSTENFSLTGITLRAGTKRRLASVPAAQSG